MNGLVGDDSIVHATLWMILILAGGTGLLTLAIALIGWGARRCRRSFGGRINESKRAFPEL